MATGKYKVTYQGLRKRESDDDSVDYLESKQEQIRYPNRLAKQLREPPQLSNLLDGDGEGTVEMEKQQINKIKHEQAELAVKQVASSSGGTAQVLRTAASQTDKPIMTIAGTQSDKPVMRSEGTQSFGSHTQIFDMALDEKVSGLSDKIEAESVKQAEIFFLKRVRNIPQLIACHLGERILSPNVRSMVSLIERGLGRGLPSSSNQEMQLEPIYTIRPYTCSTTQSWKTSEKPDNRQ